VTTRKGGGKTKAGAAPKTPRERRRNQPGYAAAAKLRGQILELKTLGRTIAQIAEAVNRAPSVVHTHLHNALDELDEEQRAQADRYRALALARLERLLSKAMLRAVAGAGDLKAMREASRLIQAQARILGWDYTPPRINPETGTGFGVDGSTAPPGTWTLPMRPSPTLEDWQREAEGVWQAQQKREAEALGEG
jgi:hypothetical protein